jgi:FMN phosphatase YigB (HAD superfamily)
MTNIISGLTIDFWETLYRHRGESHFRHDRRNQFVASALFNAETADAVGAARTLLDTYGQTINDSWTVRHQPATRAALASALDACGPWGSPVDEIRSALHTFYSSVVRPVLLPGARRFLTMASRTSALAVVSDTYIVSGVTMRQVMADDGILGLFESCYFSDELGTSKPNTPAGRMFLERTGLEPSHVVHIGDLLDRDGSFAARNGFRFLEVRPDWKWPSSMENVNERSEMPP